MAPVPGDVPKDLAPIPSSRRSRLDPEGSTGGRRLVFGDLHNHSLLSDGSGDPERAFGQLREAGLDVAAITDHSSIPRHLIGALGRQHYPDEAAVRLARSAPRSIDDAGWRRLEQIADAHDEPGVFTALRGFEWTEPWLGHVNVWFSDQMLAVDRPGSLTGLHEWLSGTDRECLYGYNHPGREPGRLEGFRGPDGEHAGSLGRRMVTTEAFNRTDDFLFRGWQHGRPSPLVEVLDRGWRPGLIGSSDEHGRSYGLLGKGRTGLWVRELSRAGVREALLERQVFATREVGLRLDAQLDGVPMGQVAALEPGPHRLTVDLDWPGASGAQATLQLLTGRQGMPHVVHTGPAQAGTLSTATLELTEQLDWLLLRVADPARASGDPGPAGHPANAWALAYASPWWDRPAGWSGQPGRGAATLAK